MHSWAFTILIALVPTAFASQPEIRINAVVSLATIQRVVKQVRKVDKRPLLSITQPKKVSVSEGIPRIDLLPADSYDTESLIIETGVLSGPLNGGGGRYFFRRVKGHWVLTKSESWVA